MCAKLVDPRITMDGKRILIDGILLRTWLKNLNIGMTTFYRCYKKDMSVTDIENKYKNHKRAPAKEHVIQYKDKEWTISELHRSGLCRKDVSENALRNRILTHHWDIGRALSEAPRPRRGHEVEYKGKVYDSISKLCSILGVCEYQVHDLMRGGVSLEQAIEYDRTIGRPTVLYKGQHVRIASLVNHPDNIHKVDYAVIVGRIRTLKYTPEEALAIPKKKIKVRSFTYKGKEYDSKKDLAVTLNLGYSDYHKLSGIDPDTPEFSELVDKLVASK